MNRTMTEKPVKPLSERIREARHAAMSECLKRYGEGNTPQQKLWAAHSDTFSFLAELAEMMEKK